MMTPSTDSASSNASMLYASIGRPLRGRSTFSGAPSRVPRPAATMIAIAEFNALNPSGLLRRREDHPSGGGLEEPGHGYGDLLTNQTAAAVDDNHRAVIQEPNTLSGFAPFLDHVQRNLLTGTHERTEGVGELVQVQHLDVLHLSDPVEVVVISENPHAA